RQRHRHVLHHLNASGHDNSDDDTRHRAGDYPADNRAGDYPADIRAGDYPSHQPTCHAPDGQSRYRLYQ
ncbi:MAG: hypothetical protein ACRDVD_03625, partial [Acidimicrobiia bacterium]